MANRSRSPSRRSKSPFQHRGRSKTKHSSRAKTSQTSSSDAAAAEKDARKRNLALTKQFDKAKKQAEAIIPPIPPTMAIPSTPAPGQDTSTQIHQDTPPGLQIFPLRHKRTTPYSQKFSLKEPIPPRLCLGSHAPPNHLPSSLPRWQGSAQKRAIRLPSPRKCATSLHNSSLAAHSPSPSHHSDQSLLDEEEAFDYSLSGDEEETPLVRTYSTGLFHRSLKHKVV